MSLTRMSDICEILDGGQVLLAVVDARERSQTREDTRCLDQRPKAQRARDEVLEISHDLRIVREITLVIGGGFARVSRRPMMSTWLTNAVRYHRNSN